MKQSRAALALRLMREAKWNIINVAVTQGSLEERKASRLEECARPDYLGFGLETTAPGGLSGVRPTTRAKDPQAWSGMVEISPRCSKTSTESRFLSHQLDWNQTHIGTHLLVIDALKLAKKYPLRRHRNGVLGPDAIAELDGGIFGH